LGCVRKRLSVTVRQEECARKPGPNRTAASRHHHATRKSGRVDASVLPRTSGLVVVVVVVNVKPLIARLSSSSSYISYSSFFHRHPLSPSLRHHHPLRSPPPSLAQTDCQRPRVDSQPIGTLSGTGSPAAETAVRDDSGRAGGVGTLRARTELGLPRSI